eukprot:CAMPEP_0114115894 /NCGR_PEP_ID=MMETSP0043_2-20121206/4209_1 /TAXON_ID=464988 /ORGANISM="Hemiselmis andersenii, Strain CCMP644" /LENGTH=76 /DNA_ID=CAMNT_0001208181 /DNA_START=517 /DNA_END=744 /DNA_ORIENTATION=-
MSCSPACSWCDPTATRCHAPSWLALSSGLMCAPCESAPQADDMMEPSHGSWKNSSCTPLCIMTHSSVLLRILCGTC